MTPQEIIQIGQQIAGETTEGGNTAERVGGVIEGIGLRLQAILEEIDNLPSVGDDEISPTSTNFVKNLVIYSALQSLKSEINGTTGARIDALQTTVSGWISSLRSTLEDEIANAAPGLEALKQRLLQLKTALETLDTELGQSLTKAETVNDLMVEAERARQIQWDKMKADVEEATTKRVLIGEETTVTMQPNVMYVWGVVPTLELEMETPVAGQLNEYQFAFNSGETPTSLVLSVVVDWTSSVKIEANMHYEVNIEYNEINDAYYGIIVGWPYTAPEGNWSPTPDPELTPDE